MIVPKIKTKRIRIKEIISLILISAASYLLTNLSTNNFAYANNRGGRLTDALKKRALNTKDLNIKDICPSSNSSILRSFKTKKYRIYICSADDKNALGYYVRIPKSGGKFVAPIGKIEDKTYIAFKERTAYVVNPYESLVSKKGRIILRERVKKATGEEGERIAKGCNSQDKVFAQAETKSFIVYICGEESPSRYIAIARNNSKRTEISLKSNLSGVKSDVHRYLATRGNIRYVLTKRTLRISHKGRTILKEQVLRWY